MKHRLLIPIAVAAAVAVMVTPATASATVARPAVTATTLPSFIVVDHASSLKVFNTSTGAAVGTLNAPKGQKFQGVASGGTSQTFLAYTSPASASAACHAWYYRFTLSAAGAPSGLTKIGSVKSSLPTAIAATPGGGTVTFSAVHCFPAPPNGLIAVTGKAGNHVWAYDEGDDYTFSLAATAGGGKLALSLFAASGWADLLLNTHSSAATVDGASTVVPKVPYADTLTIYPTGATLYACISSNASAELAAYSAATGQLVRVLHRWTLGSGFCQVSADATGKLLLASYSSSAVTHPALFGFNTQTGASVRLPVKNDYVIDGIQAAW